MGQNTALRPDEHTRNAEIDPGLEHSLCLSCAHLETCTLRGQGAIVQFCEEFEVKPGLVQRAFPREAEASRHVEAAWGLCATCTHREECVLRTTAQGGVWYCEEYE